MIWEMPENLSITYLDGVAHLQPIAEEDFVAGLLYNCADGRLADRRVRQALNLAVNRRAFIERNLRGAGTSAGGYVGEGRYAPVEAARLLEDAGWTLDRGVRVRGEQRLDFEVLVPSPPLPVSSRCPPSCRASSQRSASVCAAGSWTTPR